MPVDARIPLLAQVADPAGAFQRGVEISNTNRLNDLVMDQKQKEAGSADLKRQFESLLGGSVELLGHIGTEGPVTAQSQMAALNAMQNRREVLRRSGVADTSQTDQAIQMLQSGDYDNLRAAAGRIVNAGRQMGAIAAPKTDSSLNEVGSSVDVMIDGKMMRVVPITKDGVTHLNVLGESSTRTAVQQIQDEVDKQTALQTQTPQGQAQTAKRDAEAQEATEKGNKAKIALREVYDLANDLKRHPGRESATGGSSIFPSRPGGQAKDFEVKLKRLDSLLTLDNLGLMSGVLSETDIQILRAAAAGLDLGMPEEAFVGELDRIIGKAGAALGLDGFGGDSGDTDGGSTGGSRKTINGVQYIKIDGQWYKE